VAVTERQRARILELRRQGYTLGEIGERFGKSAAAICTICRWAGVRRGPLRHSRRFRETSNMKRDQEIRKMREMYGSTYRELGRIFGISWQRAQQIVKGDRPR
jgi:hypothetical protein